MPSIPHIVIVGGGFGGLYAAQHLKHAPAQITLIDRRNFHLFQPLLYQVATGGLSPANIAAPLRAILKKHTNTHVLLAEVTEIDAQTRTIRFADGGSATYDYLIVAAGASHTYFGHDEWARYAPGLKTLEDATEIRRKVLLAFEAAERETDPELRQAWLRFVVVGGGPTGVELAGTLGEIAHQTLKHNFRNIDPRRAEILLIEASEHVLDVYADPLPVKAEKALKELGVKVIAKAKATDIQADHVKYVQEGQEHILKTFSVLWGAGVQASPLGKVLEAACGATLDRAGRVSVEPDLSVPGHGNIFVIGDLSTFKHQGDKPLPGVAPVAMQMGEYVAKLLKARIANPQHKAEPFKYFDKGSMATIGRSRAVAELGPLRISGWLAWMMWLFVHVLFLVRFENRLLVMTQWAANYFTRNRSARLITGPKAVIMPLVTRQQASPVSSAPQEIK